MRTLTKKLKLFWNQERETKMSDGKLDTYFSFKNDFCREPYLDLPQYQLRKSICKTKNKRT